MTTDTRKPKTTPPGIPTNPPTNAPRNVNRTCRRGLSTFVSTNTTDCHVPNAIPPDTTGTVTDGDTKPGNT